MFIKNFVRYSKNATFLRKENKAFSFHPTNDYNEEKSRNIFSKQVTFGAIRAAHTDIQVPNFDTYRRRSLMCSDIPTSYSESSRKTFSYLIASGTITVALYGVKSEVGRLVGFMAPTADVMALAKIEINLADVPQGKSVTFKWRGLPLFIRHRTDKDIEVSRHVPLEVLRDPATDEERCVNPKFLVVLGICTHLGCVPIADSGDFGPGGYYCPCHGSHFDAAGRIRKGPAPTNLVIPPHEFVGEKGLIIG